MLCIFHELEAGIERIAIAVKFCGHLSLQRCFELLVLDVDAVRGDEGALDVACGIELPDELIRLSYVRKTCFLILLSRYFSENGEIIR